MGLFTRLAVEAVREASKTGIISAPPAGTQRWTIDVDDFGFADVQVVTADIDGSGEAPGVQLEVEHSFTPGRVAVALSSREARLLGRALLQASGTITPHEQLKVTRTKWQRKREKDPSSLQPRTIPRPDTEEDEVPF